MPLYRPAASEVTPAEGLVLHLHGGGFVFHDLEVHDASARRLANRSGLAVLSVDYRKPPEHRFPAAPPTTSTRCSRLARGPDLGEAGPPIAGPLYAHGDSAGATRAGRALRNPGFRAVALIYPFLDHEGPGSSPTARPPTASCPARPEWYWQQYAGPAADLGDPDLAPLLSDRLGTLPPTLVVTAG